MSFPSDINRILDDNRKSMDGVISEAKKSTELILNSLEKRQRWKRYLEKTKIWCPYCQKETYHCLVEHTLVACKKCLIVHLPKNIPEIVLAGVISKKENRGKG